MRNAGRAVPRLRKRYPIAHVAGASMSHPGASGTRDPVSPGSGCTTRWPGLRTFFPNRCTCGLATEHAWRHKKPLRRINFCTATVSICIGGDALPVVVCNHPRP